MNRLAVAGALAAMMAAGAAAAGPLPAGAPDAPVAIPTGQSITPLAAPGAVFLTLNPHLKSLPDFLAGQAAAAALSPDGRTLLILTSGFNRNAGPDGKPVWPESGEYVFVFDVSGPSPVQRQALSLPNAFVGLAWSHDGRAFYVSGGSDDDVVEFTAGADGRFAQGRTFRLGHTHAVGGKTRPEAAGLALSPDGRRLLVANIENDSVSLVDLASGRTTELGLRPGGGRPGGTFPRPVIWASGHTAYVGTERDREIIRLAVDGDRLEVARRLATAGQPNAFLLGRGGRRLYAAEDNTDQLVVVDAASGRLIETTPTAAPAALLRAGPRLGGAGSNALALSPDGRELYVSDGGENAVAVVRLGGAAQGRVSARGRGARSAVVGLIPTGWYPAGVAVSRDGSRLYVVNGKSNSGPNPEECGPDTSSTRQVNTASTCARGSNEYVWQLEKAGFLALPTPHGAVLAGLTRQTALNDHMLREPDAERDARVMDFLHQHIRHVIYVLKENRTYDEVLGDLGEGNGDPKLAILGGALSPNHHRLARQFVDLDNLLASGEGSNTGWPWSISARTNDFDEREAPVNYAQRGMDADQFGANRGILVGKSPAQRKRLYGKAYDPDVLAGRRNVASPDGPDEDEGNGFIWTTALKAGLWVRNYGFLGFAAVPPPSVSMAHEPWKTGTVVYQAGHPGLEAISDPYYHGIDIAYPDYWRYAEWKREFDGFSAKGSAPALMLVDLPTDHFGQFKQGIDGVDTVETQMADNDYALGLIVQAVADSPFARDTLIFVIEDDAQDGPDHVDSHRTVGFVIGPYVKRGAVVSTRYTTVNFVRTMERILGIAPIGLNDAFAPPMTDVFDISGSPQWSYRAVASPVLATTRIPLPPQARADAGAPALACLKSLRSSVYWQAAMAGQDFSRVDHLDIPRFNRALWRGLKGGRARMRPAAQACAQP